MKDEENTQPNKFAQGVEESMKLDRPNFVADSKNGQGDKSEEGMPTGDYRKTEDATGKKYSAYDLGEAERNASQTGAAGQNNEGAQSGLDTVKNGEKSPQQNFKYSGKGKPAPGPTAKERAKGFLKKKGPIAAVCITLIAILAVMAFSAGSSEIVNWKENTYSMFGQNSAIMNKRSNFMMKRLLRTNKGIKTTLFGGRTKFTISGKLGEKLQKEGLTYAEVDGEGGKKVRVLVKEESDGTGKVVVADSADLELLNGKTEIDIGDGKTVQLSEKPMTLVEARSTDKAFRTSYDNATLTFTGKVAGWFDEVADTLFGRIDPDARSKTKDFDGDSEEEVKEKMAKNNAEGSENSTVQKKVEDEETDDEGDKKTHIEEMPEDDSTTIGADADAKSKLNDIGSKFALGGNAYCGFIRAMGAINTTIGALMRSNAIKYATLFLEIADKIKAGDSTSATHAMMRQVNEKQTTKGYDNKTGQMVEVTGSIADSDGFNASMSSTNIIDEDDPSAMMSNYEAPMKVAMGVVAPGNSALQLLGDVAQYGGSVEAFNVCTGVQVTSSLLGFSTDVVSFVPVIGGAAKLAKAIGTNIIEGALAATVMTVVGIVIEMITPIFAEWLASSIAGLVFGQNGGFVMFSGAHDVMESNTQMSTGRYADQANAIQVGILTREVETQWAQHERDTLSPFDTSSIYTFLGSIKNSMLPILNQSGNGVMSVVSSTAQLTGSSALALVSPTASAAEKGANLSFGSADNCHYLASVGVAGDAMCNKYVGAYVEDLDVMDPDTNFDNMVNYGAFATDSDGEISTFSDGNPKVRDGSNYAKFIIACVTNDAQPGTMSSAVQGYLQQTREAVVGDNVVANGLLDFAMNFVPGSDLLDTIDAWEQQSVADWNSGKNCTGNTGDTAFDEEIRNYSAYNLDQRVLQSMDLIDESSTAMFLDDYYKENPLDQSTEGVLARYSGMTKEEVSDTLALMKYYNYVANYDPSERYAFGEEQVKAKRSMMVEENSVTQTAREHSVTAIMANVVTFADVRNRTVTV